MKKWYVPSASISTLKTKAIIPNTKSPIFMDHSLIYLSYNLCVRAGFLREGGVGKRKNTNRRKGGKILRRV